MVPTVLTKMYCKCKTKKIERVTYLASFDFSKHAHPSLAKCIKDKSAEVDNVSSLYKGIIAPHTMVRLLLYKTQYYTVCLYVLNTNEMFCTDAFWPWIKLKYTNHY